MSSLGELRALENVRLAEEAEQRRAQAEAEARAKSESDQREREAATAEQRRLAEAEIRIRAEAEAEVRARAEAELEWARALSRTLSTELTRGPNAVSAVAAVAVPEVAAPSRGWRAAAIAAAAGLTVVAVLLGLEVQAGRATAANLLVAQDRGGQLERDLEALQRTVERERDEAARILAEAKRPVETAPPALTPTTPRPPRPRGEGARPPRDGKPPVVIDDRCVKNPLGCQ